MDMWGIPADRSRNAAKKYTLPIQESQLLRLARNLPDVLKLNPQQISRVLLTQEPPYSLKDVERMLTETKPDATAEFFHEGVD